jgi:zeaxanthin epoxidase
MVLSEELGGLKRRDQIAEALERYRRRRLIRSAAVQGLSRFASDIIIRGFDTPAKITDSGIENFNYAGIVTRVLQPVLPVFFNVQFNFLYNDWRNKFAIDLGATVGILLIGGLFLVAYAAVAGDVGILAALGLEGVLGSAESGGVVEAIQAVAPEIDSLL